MVTHVCVLRAGGDYGPEHVQWLARQVPGLRCLSDQPVAGVETIPLRHDWPGWWSKLELFRPDIPGDLMFYDLDTVVLSPLPAVDRTTVLRDWVSPESMNSSLMYIAEADKAAVWEAFTADPAGHMARCGRGGDQAFLDAFIGGAQKWQDIVPVYSYKTHCLRGVPADAVAVCFHGKPRPWAAKADWVPPLIKLMGTFQTLILAHKGKRICVMGGAPSLAEHLDQVKADLYISTNGHGADLVTPDYVLAMDELHHSEHIPMRQYLHRKTSAPIITPHPYADYQLMTWPQNPRFVLSGMVATWAAWAMGAKVVILAGMDGYGGDKGYVFEATKMARDVHGPVRVVGGGPLAAVWPAYDPDEKFGRYTPHPSIDGLRNIDGLTTIKVLKRTTIRGREVYGGEQMTVYRHEVGRLLKHKMVVEVAA